MSDDKPKHKPQKKHTLSEVLKSLQDLIRTDLVTAPAAPRERTAAGSHANTSSIAPVTPAEPDSFNEALDKLDDIITHNIIEPVERAKDAPPEPLLPEETLEIEWDDTEPLMPIGSETIDIESSHDAPTPEPAEPPPEEQRERPMQTANNVVELEIIQMETEPDEERETIDLDAPETEPDTTDNVIEFDAGATDETIELTSVSDDVAPDTIELPPEAVAEFTNAKHGQEPAAEAKPPAPEPAATAVPEVDPQQELFATYVAPPKPLTSTNDDTTTVPLDPAMKTSQAASETAAAAPPAGGEDTARQASPETHAEGAHNIPSLTVDFDVTQLSATPDDATAAKMAEAAVTPSAPTVAQERPPPEPTQPKAPKTPERAAETLPARSPETPAKEANDQPARSKHAAAAPPTNAPVQQDIPVLKEVANVNAPLSAPLPSAGQARDIAIRVIAKLNIERRKAGEAPLDIKTIEKLQQYLADALNKRTLNKPK